MVSILQSIGHLCDHIENCCCQDYSWLNCIFCFQSSKRIPSFVTMFVCASDQTKLGPNIDNRDSSPPKNRHGGY